MATGSILKEDRVANTIHFINNLIRMQTNKKAVKKVDTDYFVFAGNTIDTIIDMIQNKAAKTAVVVDDLGLQVINRLGQEGIRDITLVIARLPESCMPTIKYIITNTFPDIKVTIKHINEIGEHMKTDLLISNPAYGAIGANITDMIRQKIDFEEFINLLPANDYKRNTTNDLFNYQSDMKPAVEVGEKAFVDASVTTHVARLHKAKVNNMTLAEFTISQCTDKSLDKYFKESINRTLVLDYKDPSGTKPSTWLVNRTLLVGWRDVANGHFPYDKNIETYLWNKLETIDKTTFIEAKNRERAKAKGSYELCYFTYTFKTALEKHNICEFIYSDLGFKFMSKIFKAENSDGNKEIFVSIALPKPSTGWTRSWTVEEILADYGYTGDRDHGEIKEIIDDLDNFQGMDK